MSDRGLASGITGPLLIAFVGIDGTGKSTQIRNFVEWLSARSRSQVVVKKMAGAGDAVLKELAVRLFGDPHRYQPGIPPSVRAIALAVDVSHFYQNEIKPELDAGHIVVSDRYAQCHHAYFRAYGADMEWPSKILSLAAAPDITFSLDGSPEEALQRILRRDAGPTERETNLAEMRQVREAYLELSREYPPTRIIDAMRDSQTVAAVIQRSFLEWWDARQATPR